MTFISCSFYLCITFSKKKSKNIFYILERIVNKTFSLLGNSLRNLIRINSLDKVKKEGVKETKILFINTPLPDVSNSIKNDYGLNFLKIILLGPYKSKFIS